MDRLGGNFSSHDDGADDYDYVEDIADSDTPPSPVGQDERRMQVRAYNHWAGLLQDRNFPSIEDLDPDSLEDFGPYSVLLDFSTGIDDPAVQYLGNELRSECGDEGVIDKLSDVPSRSLLSRITDHYMQILANQAPIGFEAEFVNQRGVNVLYRGILLPYSSDDDTIDFIYGVINWKEMADQQTADELLLEIDQALGRGDEEDVAITSDVDEETEDNVEDGYADEDVLDLGKVGEVTDEPVNLPEPSFGQPGLEATPAPEPEYLGGEVDWSDELPEPANAFDDAEEVDYSVDYGEQGLEDGEIGDDVDDVVDPLEDEETEASLVSLVSRGGKPKPTVELPSAFGHSDSDNAEAAVPQPYEPEHHVDEFASAPITVPLELGDDKPAEDVSSVAHAEDGFEQEPVEGLHDTLAAARELAQVASSSEDRTRVALYAAVGRAYDFSIEAKENPAGFEELVSDNGLSVQERAPMTPVVKLVFGSDYDKTRLTEYAAVLSHAHRKGVARGALETFLGQAEGGLKGVVKEERRLRREEAGKPARNDDGIKASLVRKLRDVEPVELADLDTSGPEFALVMVRRTPEGEVVVLGEIPDDVKLVERAGNRLVA